MCSGSIEWFVSFREITIYMVNEHTKQHSSKLLNTKKNIPTKWTWTWRKITHPENKRPSKFNTHTPNEDHYERRRKNHKTNNNRKLVTCVVICLWKKKVRTHICVCMRFSSCLFQLIWMSKSAWVICSYCYLYYIYRHTHTRTKCAII